MGNFLPKEERPYFGKGQIVGLPGLVVSYVLAWYCYVLTASNDTACSAELVKCVPWYKPTTTQWFGLLVTTVIATLAFLTFWLNVQGSPNNLIVDKEVHLPAGQRRQVSAGHTSSRFGIGSHLRRIKK
jgi:hypothetical protein